MVPVIGPDEVVTVTVLAEAPVVPEVDEVFEVAEVDELPGFFLQAKTISIAIVSMDATVKAFFIRFVVVLFKNTLKRQINNCLCRIGPKHQSLRALHRL
jgi:hypothetical protein